jgi:hypothetical protein
MRRRSLFVERHFLERVMARSAATARFEPRPAARGARMRGAEVRSDSVLGERCQDRLKTINAGAETLLPPPGRRHIPELTGVN